MSVHSLFLFVFIAVFDLVPSALAYDGMEVKTVQGGIHSQDAFSGQACWSLSEQDDVD